MEYKNRNGQGVGWNKKGSRKNNRRRMGIIYQKKQVVFLQTLLQTLQKTNTTEFGLEQQKELFLITDQSGKGITKKRK